MDRTERDEALRLARQDGDARRLVRDRFEEASIGELFKRLTTDASLLVRQEVGLARAGVEESLRHVKAMIVALAVAAALAVPGAIALTAFLVIALGSAINSYWAAALIVGVVLLAAGALLACRAMANVQNARAGMQQTAESLGEDARWGREELRAFKRELTA